MDIIRMLLGNPNPFLTARRAENYAITFLADPFEPQLNLLFTFTQYDDEAVT